MNIADEGNAGGMPANQGRSDLVVSPLILLVENGEALRKVLTTLLERAGYRVLQTATGSEALQAAATKRPALVISKPLSKETLLASVEDALHGDIALPFARTEPMEAEHTQALIDNLTEMVSALAASEERFRQLAETIADVFCLSDPANTKIFYVSPAYEKIWGRPCESLYASPCSWADAIHPEDRPGLHEGKARTFEKGTSEKTYRILRPDGSIRWILDRVFAVRDESGQVVRVAWIAKNITERKQAEDQLRERERRLSTLISNLPGVVFRVRNDPNYTTEYVSDQIAELTGYPADDFRENRRNFGELMHSDDRDRVWNEIQKALGEHRPYEVSYRFMDAHGRERWNWERGTGIYDANGELQAVEGFVQDITARKQAEERLGEREELLTAILEYFPGLISAKDLAGVVIMANSKFELLDARGPAQFIGKSVYDLFPNDVADALWANDRAAQKAGIRIEAEETVAHRDGTLHTYLTTKFPLYRRAEVFATCAISVDVTARKQAEAALHESEERLRLFAEQAPAPIAMLDENMNYLATSKRWLSEHLSEDRNLIGRNMYEVFPDIPERWKEIHRRCLSGTVESSEADPWVRADGGTHWVRWEMGPWRKRDGTIGGLVVFSENITANKNIEVRLSESEARLRLSVAASNIGLWDWNLVTNDVYFSPEWKGQLGCADDEIPNRFEEWESRLHPDDLAPTVTTVRAFIENPEAHYVAEFRMRHKDGSWRWIFTQAQVFRNAAGKPLRMMGCHIDITERKRTEAEVRMLSLQLSRTEEEQRRQIARELHDSTGQKLAALSMTVGLLQDATSARDGKTEKMFADCLAMIDQCAQEIRTHSYLLHPPLLDELGLSVAISNYVEGFSKRSGVRVVFDPPPDFERFPDLLEIALFRVVQESMGNIHRHAGAASARIRLACDAEHVTLEVSDQGRGISAEMLHALETGRGATGVGIAGLRERLRLLGGRLEIESGKHGTTVRAIVPPRPEPA